MKNLFLKAEKKLVAKYFENNNFKEQKKSTNINILLNRIELNKKSESRKKLYFSAIASTGLIMFGLIIF